MFTRHLALSFLLMLGALCIGSSQESADYSAADTPFNLVARSCGFSMAASNTLTLGVSSRLL
jgi:hypothetical protein